jgi:hypothetical protein
MDFSYRGEACAHLLILPNALLLPQMLFISTAATLRGAGSTGYVSYLIAPQV